MPSAESDSTRRHAQARGVPRRLRPGLWLGAALAAIVALELGLSQCPDPANAPDDPIAIALTAHPISDRDLFRLHRALSRGEPHASGELVRELLAAPDGRVREFAASPTLAKFGHAEAIERAIAARRRPREAFRMRLWHYYQLGVHDPPRSLTMKRIRDHFASLEGDPLTR